MTDIPQDNSARNRLIALADEVERLAEPDREIDALIWWQAVGRVLETEPSLRPKFDENPSKALDDWCGAGWRWESSFPPLFTDSFEAALGLIPEGMILRRYVSTTLVPHSCEVSKGPSFGGWDGNSDHSMALALTVAALRAKASIA